MTTHAFVLVGLVVLVLVTIIVAQMVLLDRARVDARGTVPKAAYDRLLNALLAENAAEMERLDRSAAEGFVRAEIAARRVEATPTRGEPPLPVPHGMG